MAFNLNSMLETVAQVEKDNQEELGWEKGTTPWEFLSLSCDPFLDSVNSRYFFKTPQYEEACLKMMLCVKNNGSLGMVHGLSGLGKTLLSQVLLQNLQNGPYKIGLVLAYPGISRQGLLREIALEANLINKEDSASSTVLMEKIQEFMIELYRKGQKFVLLIDEAHFLSATCLHTIRSMSNIEVPEQKLCSIVLFAENKLWKRLQDASHASLRGRLFYRVELKSMGLSDAQEYIKYRTLVAGGRLDLFSEKATEMIYNQAQGICREINKICSNVLIELYLQKKTQVDEALVAQVLEKI